MAAALTLKSGVTVVWGVPDAHKQAGMGVVKSVRRGRKAKKKEYPDESGETAAVVLYDKSYPLTLEILAKTSATVPAVGDTLTHATEKYLIDEVTENWQNEDVQSISITATQYTSITLA